MLSRGIFVLSLACACLPLVGCIFIPFVGVRSAQRPEDPSAVSHGYILFRYQPSGELPRDLEICQRIFAWLKPEDPDTSERAAPTYFPTTEYIPADPRRCADILNKYDRNFADRIIATLPASGEWHVFLMAQSVPHGEPEIARVCVDLTQDLEVAGLDQGLNHWYRLMAAGPEFWKPSGFSRRILQILAWFEKRGRVHVDCR